MRLASRALVTLSGAWALFNTIRFTLDAATRHRAEAAWFLFAAVLVLVGIVSWRRPPGETPPLVGVDWRAGAALVAAALLLYSPLAGIGLLSDDFVLLERAGAGRLIDPDWDHVRPLPLALWSVVGAVVPAGSVPAALHLVNIVGHGINGWLLFGIARTFALTPLWAAAASALFLVAPFSIEPVAWASGVFDIALTMAVLGAVLVLRTPGLPPATIVGCVSALTLIAVGSKETAVAMPAMLALFVPFAPAGRRRCVIAAVTVSGAIVASYVGWRLSVGIVSPVSAETSGYGLKEILSRPFGALGYGFHVATLEKFPWLGPIFAALWPLILIRSALGWSRDTRAFQVLLLAALWVLCSVLPVFTMMYVSPELEGSRYLYLGSSLWSLALIYQVAVATVAARWAKPIVGVAVVASAFIMLNQQSHWRAAGAEREKVLAAFARAHGECPPASVENVPDMVRGAYVFRNGFAEAARRSGLTTSGGECRLRWNGESFDAVH